MRWLRLTPPGACLAARMSARACRDAERLSGDDSRWFFMPQLRGLLCAATASRSSSSFFRITLLPRISGGRWRYMRGKQTISTSSVAPPTADQPLSDAKQFAPCAARAKKRRNPVLDIASTCTEPSQLRRALHSVEHFVSCHPDSVLQ